MKTKTALRIVLAAGALAIPRKSLAELGLRTKFAEVSVDRVKIGQTYSMMDLVNFPLRVLNSGTEPLPLKVDVVAPQESELKRGYEIIPDPSWVTLQQSTFTVPPGIEAVSDVMIAVPNDESLLGRRFQVLLWTQSTNASSMGVGLKSRLLIGVSSQKPSDEELKKKFVKKRVANLNFNLSPMEVSLPPVEPGELFKLKGEHIVKILNPNSTAIHFRLTPISVWETSVSPPPGIEPAGDPKWLIVKKPVLKVKPDRIQALDLAVRLPKEEHLRGRRFLLVLRAEILDQDIPAYAYVQIFVEVKK